VTAVLASPELSEAPVADGRLPFAELLEALRRQGFEIGVDHYVRLYALLARIGGECEPRALRTLLCPIFATSRETQEQFFRVFDQQYQLFALKQPDKQDETAAGDSPALLAGTPPSFSLRRFLFGAALLTIIVVTAVWLVRKANEQPPLIGTAVREPIVTPGVRPPTVNEPGTLEPRADPSEPPAPAGSKLFGNRWVQLVILLIPLALFGLYEWYRYRRRKLLLQKERREKPPFLWPIRVPSITSPYANSEEFYRAARALRQRETSDSQRLALEETVAATVAAGGYPTFRYRSDTRPPEYLLLIERTAFRDHQADLFGSLVSVLEREGVHLARYYYDGDPRVCFPEPGDTGVLLNDLLRKHPRHRLLVFGTGDKLIDPISGRLQPWVETFIGWNDRALLTPESPSAWGRRELVLARHFIVLPATTAGLAAVRDHFSSIVHPDWRGWLAADGGVAALDGGPTAVVQALRRFLGEAMFQWLCACALYPELYWDLTLYLGSLNSLQPGVVSEQNLLRLIRLPWFRAGSIPDDIRAVLLEQLDPTVADAARKAIVELLEQNPPPHEAVAATRYQLDLAVQRLALSGRDRKRRKQLLREIRALPRSEVMQDRALVGLLERVPRTRLAIILPRRLRRVFYDNGIPEFGWSTAGRFGASATATLVAGFLMFYQGELSGSSEQRDALSESARALSRTTVVRGGSYPAPSPMRGPSLPPRPEVPRTDSGGRGLATRDPAGAVATGDSTAGVLNRGDSLERTLSVEIAPLMPAPVLASALLYQDISSGIRDSTRLVIRDADSFNAYWQRATSSQPTPPPVPAIDFSKEMIVLVAAGRMNPQPEFRVDDVRVGREQTGGEAVDVLTIVVETVQSCSRIRVDAYPISIMRVSKFDGPVRWEDRLVQPVCPDEPARTEAGPASIAAARERISAVARDFVQLLEAKNSSRVDAAFRAEGRVLSKTEGDLLALLRDRTNRLVVSNIRYATPDLATCLVEGELKADCTVLVNIDLRLNWRTFAGARRTEDIQFRVRTRFDGRLWSLLDGAIIGQPRLY
jgi:hypothetical protein